MRRAVTKRSALRALTPGALLALGVAFGCNRAPSGQKGAESGAASSVQQRTTRGDLAVRNLNDRVQMLEKRAARGPLGLPLRESLVETLLTRSQFLGTFTDLARVAELGEGAVREHPENAKAYQLRARAASAVHRFDDAKNDLETARKLGGDVDAALASVSIAQGRDLERARDFARSRVERARTTAHLSLLANAEAALGELDAADEHYAASLATLRDVTPFPVAQLSFARGVMWAEQANRPDLAQPFYAEAVRRLPQYVVANVHLAEIEASLGQRDAAITRLRSVVDATVDPEPKSVLGELLAARDPKDPAAAELVQRARTGYESLLASHRTAFLDHGAEFFGGPGADPALALRLARENLELRPTPRAYTLAIEAALGAHDTPLGCQLMDVARSVEAHSKNLAAVLARESGRCAMR